MRANLLLASQILYVMFTANINICLVITSTAQIQPLPFEIREKSGFHAKSENQF